MLGSWHLCRDRLTRVTQPNIVADQIHAPHINNSSPPMAVTQALLVVCRNIQFLYKMKWQSPAKLFLLTLLRQSADLLRHRCDVLPRHSVEVRRNVTPADLACLFQSFLSSQMYEYGTWISKPGKNILARERLRFWGRVESDSDWCPPIPVRLITQKAK